jgi:hypothetical protein
MEYHGFLDEASIFNSAFNQTQVQELFNDGVALDATTHSKAGNLLGYWRNDGITTWEDRRGWSYLDFDGTNDKITTNADSTLADVTYIWWMKASDTGSNAGIFGHGTGSDNLNTSFNLNWVSNRSLFYRNGNNWRYFNDTSAQDDGQWHCWALVNDADDITGCKLYVDGNEISVYDTANAESAKAYASGLIIGHSGGTNYGEADIAKFAVYSGLKDQNFIDAEFNKGINSDWSSNSDLLGYWKLDSATTVKDLSGSGNDGTVTGATLNDGNDGDVQGSPDSITIREGLNSNKDGLGFNFTNPSSNVLRLNGVDEQIIVPDTDFNFSSQMTFECWAKNNSDNNTVNEFLISQWNYSNNQRAFRAFIHSNGALYCTISDTGSGSNTSQVNTTNAISNLDNWHHYAFTFSSGTFVIYIDGVAVTISTGSVVASITSIHNSTADIQIGSQYPPNATGGEWNGLIDEVKIYNRALSLAEIQKNYKHQKGKHKND